MPPDEARLRGKIAANSRWAATPDRATATAAARAAFLAKFEDEVDPDRRLDPQVRARLAANARTAHFQRLALASAKARRKNSATEGGVA